MNKRHALCLLKFNNTFLNTNFILNVHATAYGLFSGNQRHTFG
jgi:hypothetical protein